MAQNSDSTVTTGDEEHNTLDCEICFEDFGSASHIPKLLKCGHTLCNNCLELLKNDGKIICPNDESETILDETGVGGLSTNWIVLKALSGFMKRPSTPQQNPTSESYTLNAKHLDEEKGAYPGPSRTEYASVDVDDSDDEIDLDPIQQTARGPPNGTLVLAGGALKSRLIWDIVASLAGGDSARVAFIPTSSSKKQCQHPKKQLQKFRRNSNWKNIIDVVHTYDRNVANSEEFVEPITKADLVWFGGGRQWRSADSYLHTKTQTSLHDLLARGGVIGGSSAGASIQADHLVRGDTKGNRKMIGDHLQGLGFLKNIGIDQHVIKKNRQRDLIQFVQAFPHILGIAIDEDTAIVFKNDVFEVIGTSYVLVYDNTLWGSLVKDCKRAKLLEGERYFMLKAGDRYNVRTRRILSPGNLWGTFYSREHL